MKLAVQQHTLPTASFSKEENRQMNKVLPISASMHYTLDIRKRWGR